MKTAIQFEHVSKFFGTKQIIKDCHLSLQEGEVVAIVGPSGCGKTTFYILQRMYYSQHLVILHASQINWVMYFKNQGYYHGVHYMKMSHLAVMV